MSDPNPFWAVALMYGFFTFAATLAVIASLERTLGRPLPRLRYSRMVPKNRVFWTVPVLMAAAITWLLPKVFAMPACSHCSKPYVWQHPNLAGGSSIFVLAFSGAVGWIVYYLLLLSVSVIRLFFRPNRGTI
jgi:hypothetical protein